MNRTGLLLLVALLLLSSALVLAAPASSSAPAAPATAAAPAPAPAPPVPPQPAILFCCSGENRYGWVSYTYMQALHQAGWTVDYIEGFPALTWDKVQHFNVLFVYDFPANDDKSLPAYWAVLNKFLQAGGGIFLHYSPGYGGTAPNSLLKQWGLQLPLLWLRDPYVEEMTNMPAQLAYTDQITPGTPLSQDVHGFWYPYGNHYCGQHTMPIFVDKTWTVVARPSAAAYTVKPTYPRGDIQPPAGALISDPVKDPVLFAICEQPGGGRLAAIQTWPQFSVGSGDMWLYNNEVLSKGLAGRPSDYGKLLTNAYTWLAAPSLKSGALGGAAQDATRLVEPELRPGAIDQFHDWYYQEDKVLEYHHPPINGKIYRGLIGAQTELSGGTGTVADYAQAAAAAKLDFVVFLEDLAQMTPEKLATLKAQVAKNSTPTLKLFAGYRMVADTGNYMFVCGNDPIWPEDRLLVGPDHRIFNLQYQNEKGQWADGNPGLDWCIGDGGPGHGNTVGYYNFTKSGNGLKMYDLRVYSMAAIRTYQNGKLVEDMTNDYLTTSQSTAVPTPVSLNLVTSPAEMTAAVADNQALTYAQARTMDLLWEDALRWNGSYDGPNVYFSDGPQIVAWPKCLRVMTFGAEEFVSGRSMWPSPVHVTSDVGLKEIRIYDGRNLFRRFICNGAKDFETTLFFPGVVQRSMVLVADDIKGGRAESFAYRQYKEGTICPIFCSDHVNDCAGMRLAHGEHWPMFFMTPVVPNAGGTWDGGPLASRPLLTNQFTYPAIYTDKGNYEPPTPYQIPLLEFSDEGACRCRMVANRMMADGVPDGNPWAGFGPLQPTKIVDLWASHTYFDGYLTGVDPNSYGAPGINDGPIASLFTEQFKFKQDCTVSQMRLYFGGWRKKTATYSTILAMGRGGQITDVWDLTDTPEASKRARIDTGAWFALFSSQMANTHLFINRGQPLILEANRFDSYWLNLYADVNKLAVKAGDTYDTEIFAQTWPMDETITDAKTVADLVSYLESPTGMQLTRGTQVSGLGGLLELTPDNGAVELSIPKPTGVNRTVPVRVSGFNKRWTVGLYQFEGWRTHYYSKGNTGWRELGLDFDGRAYAPLYVSKSPNTHVLIGQPVIADAAGKDLFIQVTRLNDDPTPAWHLSVNNPTDQPITTTLQRTMDLPGLDFTQETVTLAPGEYRVLTQAPPPAPATTAATK
jgi:hypothetical protein